MSRIPIPTELTIQEGEGPNTLLLLPPNMLVRMYLGDRHGAQQHLLLIHDPHEIRLMAIGCHTLSVLRGNTDPPLQDTAAWLVSLVELQST